MNGISNFLCRSGWSSRFYLMLVSVMFCVVSAHAYTFQPGVASLKTTGDESSVFFHLSNKEMKVTAVEIVINQCRKDLDGKVIKGADAEDDFLVYPAQVILMPGDEVAVQVRWIGGAKLPSERAYTIQARQVAIPGAEEQTDPDGVYVDVKVLVNYEGRLYVAPKGVAPQVEVESASGGVDGEGNAAVEVILINRGTGHMDMKSAALRVECLDGAGALISGQSILVGVEAMPEMKTHLLAGDRRRFFVKRPSDWSGNAFRAALVN